MEDQAPVNLAWLSRWLGLAKDDSTDFLNLGVEREKVHSCLEKVSLLDLQNSDGNEVGEGTGGKFLSNHSSLERVVEDYEMRQARIGRGRVVGSLGEVILGHFLKEKNFKQTIPPVKVEDHEEITYETASTALKRAVHFFSALQASDGHWPAESAGPLFFLPPLVSHDHPPSSTVTNFNSTKKCNC
ncbi:hypothetical protein LWI29_011215 [Acer saccharum]|uniref:Uncharacterized protein n=1 Tax=Acer saccharum TaxID=4024 RepID=A0AA39T190_ACESA|nr:hypothetical protein LWI29_011215 [Acer saccharum]